MNKEKIVLSIIAILLGLFVAGGAFYIFQITRSINEPEPIKSVSPSSTPTQITQNGNFLIIDSPKNEEVFGKRIIDIKGKTTKGATIIISTESVDQVVTPNTNGNFTLTLTLEDGLSIIKFTAVFVDGSEQSITRTVTTTTEEF